ncbi:response regulator transcription factor [Streptomyces sp. HNM0663]|uniref:Response regulator transcription factor n=1 Tax=Streptomyces chengmaiensis TaxID=3040919 RepID=A0ABT6HXW0_9ACTN|nr:response regulator transcription factor [Streptomyces chengmaiensis]MDH2393546.1 response regulator transcription factor [Streptomyces chengmaiensis]
MPDGKLRIVVADDNPVVRAGLTALLHDRDGLRVVAETADGRQAHAAALRLRPDAILLDVRMPGVDGMAALPYLARLAPVLMLTYSREQKAVQEAMRRGASGYLVYGEFTADDLSSAVRDISAGRHRFTPSAAEALLPGGRPSTPSAPSIPCTTGNRTSATAYGANFIQPSHGHDLPVTPTGKAAPEVHSAIRRGQSAQPASLAQANVAHSSQGSGAVGRPRAENTALSRREVEVMELIAAGMTNQQIAASCFISQKTVKNHINRIFAKLGAGSRGEAIAIWHGDAGRGGPAQHG